MKIIHNNCAAGCEGGSACYHWPLRILINLIFVSCLNLYYCILYTLLFLYSFVINPFLYSSVHFYTLYGDPFVIAYRIGPQCVASRVQSEMSDNIFLFSFRHARHLERVIEHVRKAVRVTPIQASQAFVTQPIR